MTGRERLTVIAAALAALSAIASGVVLALSFQVLGKAQQLAAQATPSSATARPTADVAGSVALAPGRHQPVRDGEECAGAGGITNGMSVWIADGNGDIVGEGHLAGGRLDSHGWCQLDFTVAGVPAGALRYTVSFASDSIDAVGIVDLATPVRVYLD